jgi:hypothetical protein
MKSRILPVTSKNRVVLVLAGFLSIACLFVVFAVSADALYILAPISATLLIALLFWLSMGERHGKVPLADVGTVTVLATVCYTIIPPLQFLFSGMQHTSVSAYQLYVLNPTPEELGAFTWWYVVYLLSFVIGYLVIDSKNRKESGNPKHPDPGTVWSLALIFIILSAIMFGIEALYGINLYGVYDTDRMYDSYETLLQMPLLFRQFYGIIGHIGILFIVQLGLLLTIFLNWKKATYRYALYAFLSYMLASNVLWMGARTELILICTVSALMYHRFVRPLRLTLLLSVGLIFFAGFMIIGMMRGRASLGGNTETFRTIIARPETIVSGNNEFQALFGGNYDLFRMRQGGLQGEIPLQFRLYDLVMIIPQQILPFEKLDVQKWIGARSNNPSFFMFNPISQALIGFGWVELILRGALLGYVFAKTKAWYIQRASSFWATLFYFYLIIISYYTIRGTAFYVLIVSVLFRFVPLYFLVRFLTGRGLGSRRDTLTAVSVSPKIVDA